MDNYTPKLKSLRAMQQRLPQFFYSELWAIPGCSRDGDIMWSIIMAYLNHPPYNDTKLMKRIKCLQENLQLEKVRDLKNCIKNYNPFLHRNTDACDQIMNDIVLPFKDKINQFKNSHTDLFLSSFENYIYCRASSILLKCNILIFIEEVNGNKNLIAHVFSDGHPHISFNKWLVIFDTVRNNIESFAFGMSKEIGLMKQIRALKDILLKTKIAENDSRSSYSRNSIIYQICALPKIRENFILSLVKSKFTKNIPYIYKSPYVIAKLRDALFQTDPLVQDEEGKSALFHALIRGDTSLLYFLYDQTTKICLYTGGSISCSTRAVPENLLKLKDSFTQIKEQIKNTFSDDNEKLNLYLERLSCIARFNDYQTEVSQFLNNLVLSQVNNIDSCSNKVVSEAEERRKAIMCILDIYKKYFNVKDSELDESSRIQHFSEFCKHNDYINNIDFITIMRFFDHLFLLKERLMLPNSAYAEIENHFFLFIYSKGFFEQLQKYKSPSAQVVSRMLLYRKRLHLQNHADIFKKKLENLEICSDNVVKNIPEDIVETLTNLPNIYGQFLEHRLIYYLNVAISVSVGDTNSILVIERALMIIGECLKKTVVGCKTIKKILPFILPSHLVTILKRIRNSFSHFEPSHIPGRNLIEKDIPLFRNIQLELKTLSKILMPILSAQRFNMERFILLIILESVKCAMNENILSPHIESLREILPLYDSEFDYSFPQQETENLNKMKNKGNEVPDEKISYKNDNSDKIVNRLKEHCETVKRSLSAKISSLNKNCSKIDRKNACWFNYSVLNIFDTVKIIIYNLKCNDKEEMDDCMWALEYILEYISSDSKLKEYKTKFLKKMQLRKLIFLKSATHTKKRLNNNNTLNFTSKDSIVLGNGNKDFSKLYNSKLFIQNSSLNTGTLVQNSSPEQGTSNINQVISRKSKSLNKKALDKNKTLKNRKYKKYIKYEKNKKYKMSFRMFKNKIFNIISYYQEIYRDIIKDTNFKVTVQSDTNFKHIEIFKKVLTGHSFLNNKEKKKIVDSIDSSFKDIHNVKVALEKFLENKITLTNDDLLENVSKLPLRQDKKKVLYEDLTENKKIAKPILKNIQDYFGILKDAMEKDEISNKKYNTFCKKLRIPTEEQDILKKLVISQHEMAPGVQILFLRNRVQLLKEILIDSNKEIKQLSEKAKSLKTKSYLVERIVELYLKKPEVRASVEMLLFDCMNLLKNKDLNDLWRKSSNLFNGINLRNVLAHGNPLLETAGRILDPYDLPSELIRKMLQLVNDLNIIDCIVNIIEDLKGDFKNFHQIMNEDKSNKYDHLKKIILNCNNWKDYVYLIQ